MVSDRSRVQWDAFVAARSAQTTPFGEHDELHRFVVGVHLRDEPLTAQELRELLDKVTDDDAERDGLTAFVEQSLALLEFYDRLVQGASENHSDRVEGGFEL